jgi:FkbM family methyltransferase
LPYKQITLSFNGDLKLDLSPDDISHRAIILNGFYELGLTRKILKLSAQGGLMIDVGANYGYFSCLWAAANPSCKVVAIEAAPDNYLALTQNIKINHLEERTELLNLAVGNKSGVMDFILHDQSGQTGWGGLSTMAGKNAIKVKVTTLDQLAKEKYWTKIKVLKIDTEGADTWVLEGAKNLLAEKRIDHIFFEENPKRMQELGIELGRAENFLKQYKYKLVKLSPNEWYATAPPY